MIASAGVDVEQEEHSSIVGRNANLYNHSGNQQGSFSENWESTYLRTQQYPKDAQSFYKDIHSAMFIAALFVITRTWKQPRYPLTKEWIKKMWHIYTTEYYSTVKSSDILKFAYK